ncbi:hypothetical protein ACRE_018050 [Hapsidospora chrysogenum ATCC 11550]|uniref:ER transporter 6TM N-terminal domain-containing protein n=1 Tax=Hapsidospora chrysogenum (strain ATCC 11550 / CBS 779.69 / DSM 880 / IAM 14645 / JCM 23072 / IMI 49137) TaxID=857340 RepID=A0A086TDB5_HAPC1|nr:hypothetical protein ACRE_018050 [Hapsidospora chrysogenum ATCC 11550]
MRFKSDAAALENPKVASASPASAMRRWTLPAWLDHFNSCDLKILFRCWVAAWVAVLLVFIRPALVHLGQAAFFAALVLFIIPPTSILLVYLLATLTLLLGMCLAWAWGLLTMKAALAARPAAETAMKFQALRERAGAEAQQTGEDPTWLAEILVHDGFMLDARVTIIYYFTADLASLLVKPGAAGVGIGAASCVLLFPQSTSFVVLEKTEKLVRLLNLSLVSTVKRLARDPESLEHLKAYRGKVISLYKAAEPVLALLPLDMSRGRWDSDDVRGLHGVVRDAMIATLSLTDLHITWANTKEKEERLEKHKATAHDGAGGEITEKEKEQQDIGHRQLLENAHLMSALRDPEQGDMDDRAFESLKTTTAEILQVCSQSIELSARCIHTVNACRWVRKPSQRTFEGVTGELQDMLAALRSATNRCTIDTTEGLIESYADIFDEQGRLKSADSCGPPPLRGIALSMIIEERILSIARALEALLEYILQLMQSRTTHRIWFPCGLGYAASWMFSSKGSMPTVSTSTGHAAEHLDIDAVPETVEDQAKEAYRRLRVSKGYPGTSARRSPVSRAVAATYNWLFNPAGSFAIRMVVVTITTGIPAAIPSSAGFFYREKGIWAVIMAQTCVLVYMADFTFSMVSKGLGTVVGGILGMVTWYMGSGNGQGNPYGMAASSGLMLVVVLWLRIFLPPSFTKATVLSGVTFCLVVGFSYDQHHIRQYGLPGVGYEAFWKRVVTVLIGFTAATVVQVLPKPPSATNHVRRTLANTVRTLADHYALLLSHWGRRAEHNPLREVGEEISIGIADNLMALNEPISQLPFEFSLSPFDRKALRETQEQCEYMNQSLRRLLNLSTSLPAELQERLVQAVGFMDDRVIGEIMATLDIIEQSLRTGSPLPERLPAPLIGRFYSSWHVRNRHAMLSIALARDENYRRYCVATSAYLKFLSTIDDLVIILKARLGECHVIHQWEDA